jgi:hypothetical protein
MVLGSFFENSILRDFNNSLGKIEQPAVKGLDILHGHAG